MPIINIWIRDEDYSKYLVVKSKGKGALSNFMHDALTGTTKLVEKIGKEIIEPEQQVKKLAPGSKPITTTSPIHTA